MRHIANYHARYAVEHLHGDDATLPQQTGFVPTVDGDGDVNSALRAV